MLRAFAYGPDPFRRGWHRGVDLAGAPGTAVRAACSGTVVTARAVAGAEGVVTLLCGRWRVTHLPLIAIDVRPRRARPRGRSPRPARNQQRPRRPAPRRPPRGRPVRLRESHALPARRRSPPGPAAAPGGRPRRSRPSASACRGAGTRCGGGRRDTLRAAARGPGRRGARHAASRGFRRRGTGRAAAHGVRRPGTCRAGSAGLRRGPRRAPGRRRPRRGSSPRSVAGVGRLGAGPVRRDRGEWAAAARAARRAGRSARTDTVAAIAALLAGFGARRRRWPRSSGRCRCSRSARRCATACGVGLAIGAGVAVDRHGLRGGGAAGAAGRAAPRRRSGWRPASSAPSCSSVSAGKTLWSAFRVRLGGETGEEVAHAAARVRGRARRDRLEPADDRVAGPRCSPPRRPPAPPRGAAVLTLLAGVGLGSLTWMSAARRAASRSRAAFVGDRCCGSSTGSPASACSGSAACSRFARCATEDTSASGPGLRRSAPRPPRGGHAAHAPGSGGRRGARPALAGAPTAASLRRRHGLLRHHADLLRQRRAPPRARVHDDRRRHPRPPHAPARRGGLLPHRHRRARRAGRAGGRARGRHARRSSPTATPQRFQDADAAHQRLQRLLHPHHRPAPQGARSRRSCSASTTTATSTRASTRAGTAPAARTSRPRPRSGPDNTCPIHQIPLDREQRGELVLPALDASRSSSSSSTPSARTSCCRAAALQRGALVHHRRPAGRLASAAPKLTWGVEVPWDPSHVFYVWFDALLNYYTALVLRPRRRGPDRHVLAGDFHIIGKDILKFHAVFWPAMLMAAGIELPEHCSSTATC